MLHSATKGFSLKNNMMVPEEDKIVSKLLALMLSNDVATDTHPSVPY
jgi:hypothetical protein